MKTHTMKAICSAAALAAGLSFAALAAPTEVSTVAGLIAAVQNASANDEIVVMASGSPYEFSSDQKDVVAHLYAKVKITLRGETGNPDDVVLVGNANRILYLAQSGNAIRDLTFRNGDCSEYEKRSEEPYDQMRGGAIHFRKSSDSTLVSNCVFRSCKSQQGGGACAEYSNSSTGGKFYDCVFDGNSTSTMGGGAVFRATSANNCIFRNNFSGTSNGGALCNVPEVVGCSIVSNATSSSGGFGGGVYDCTLTGCFVASNYAYRCGAAADSEFYSCTNRANKSQGDYLEFGMTSGGSGCYAEDCVFIDAGKSGKKTFGKSAFNRCRFDEASFVSGSYVFSQSVSMTNSLISSVSGVRLFEGLTAASTMASCTIASNSYTFASINSSYNPVITVRNCFFCGNNDGIDIHAVATNLVVSFENCILSAESDDHLPGSGNYNYYSGRAAFKPGFVGAAKDPENPFAITRRSPAYAKAGIVEDWMETATDIRGEGFPRLRDGVVNIGCYQCWDKIPGLTISVN